jgi:hypothetical protein
MHAALLRTRDLGFVLGDFSLERFRLIFSEKEVDESFELLSEKLRPFAALAFNIIGSLVELDYIVAPNLTEDGFEDDVSPLFSFQPDFEILELVWVRYELLSRGRCLLCTLRLRTFLSDRVFIRKVTLCLDRFHKGCQ